MSGFSLQLLEQIRDRFCHVDRCPYQGERIFFENAGGSLTLGSVVQTTARLAAIPDNQGRDNPASRELVRIIEESKNNMHLFLGIESGKVFVGESGTELLFRMIRSAILASGRTGNVVGSSLEHPATRSACRQWAEAFGLAYRQVPHEPRTAIVTPEDYDRFVDADTRVAAVIQTSPVSGTAVDVAEVVSAIRAKSPDCFVIVDGIQHAAHGLVDLSSLDIDGFALSGYKVFSKHNYGVAWVSERLRAVPHERLDGTAPDHWELGTRDTSAYAAFTDVVEYLDWLGAHFTDATNRREKLVAAGYAMAQHERALVELMINGEAEIRGLRDFADIVIIGGADNPHREGLVSMASKTRPAMDIVADLNARGIRTHVRKNDYFSSNILDPLALDAAVRVSLCHYNSPLEVMKFLAAMQEIVST